jgi:hypothetical protein
MLRALRNSLIVAVFATAVSVVVGVTAALALDRYEFSGKRLFQNAILRGSGIWLDVGILQGTLPTLTRGKSVVFFVPNRKVRLTTKPAAVGNF